MLRKSTISILALAFIFINCQKDEGINDNSMLPNKENALRVSTEKMIENLDIQLFTDENLNSEAVFFHELLKVEYLLNNTISSIGKTRNEGLNYEYTHDTIYYNVSNRNDGTVATADKLSWIDHHTQSALNMASETASEIYALDIQLPNFNNDLVQEVLTVIIKRVPLPNGLQGLCDFDENLNFTEFAPKLENYQRFCELPSGFPATPFGFEIVIFGPKSINGKLDWEQPCYSKPNWLPLKVDNPNYIFSPTEQQELENGVFHEMYRELAPRFPDNAPGFYKGKVKTFDNLVIEIADIKRTEQSTSTTRNALVSQMYYYYNFRELALSEIIQ